MVVAWVVSLGKDAPAGAQPREQQTWYLHS
jgi:hypothetical protein